MSERAGDHGDSQNGHAIERDAGHRASSDGLSLKGEAGRQVAKNLARFALGTLSLDQLNDSRYTLTADGAVCLDLDEDSALALQAPGH
jgi:hypothetical protein